jgi:hypothetical protein
MFCEYQRTPHISVDHLKCLQVTQAALLKRRTGQDELRSTPDSDSVGGDDAGSM